MYSFYGQRAKGLHIHSVPGNPVVKELYCYTYDGSDRLAEVMHSLNDGLAVVLETNECDEFCRLKHRSFHGGNELLEYDYNIRN